MKILVINGSPKKDKSDTMHITRAFLDGMNEVAHNEIKIITAIDKHIWAAASVFITTICAGFWRKSSTAIC